MKLRENGALGTLLLQSTVLVLSSEQFDYLVRVQTWSCSSVLPSYQISTYTVNLKSTFVVDDSKHR